MNSFDPAQVTANWGFPTDIKVGPGRLSELPEICRELGFERPLLVTDPGVKDLPMIGETMDALKNAGLPAAMFADIRGNPNGANVDAGVEVFRSGNHDSVIAFGGGSALDAAKAIALMVGQDRPIWDFEDIGDNWKRANADGIAPCVAIPTTAGTGSEVGRASVITNDETHRKMIIFHPRMLPAAVILDPETTVGLPPQITAATGMDALSHCFEAWCAPGFHPMADGIALEGLRLIGTALPRAYDDGKDIEARTHMLAAASMGSTAFQKGLGAVHAISHPVGAIYHTHHGLTNAVMLPYVMRFNHAAIADRMGPVAQALGLLDTSFDAVFNWVLQFRERLGVPHTLADLGVDDNRADEIGRLGEIDPPAAKNPVPVKAADLEGIFVNAVNGRL
ncbi:iron-containing alcohol dehydrogenase [Halofilum ochraceum]|uniref:iron-containing alcohol dehydrogenase n=1 Tax=Halofilum ochraceum TaxID=1611323 RepID=UPI00082CF302|nr:iron-containing alcohol dehydrogenase [Halofilum ochraceum]